MKTQVASCLLGCLAALNVGAGQPAQNQNGAPALTGARQAMIGVLAAAGPHASLGEHEKVFGRLVGTWAVEYTDFSKNGKVTHRTGELLIGWIMDGRALQDVWIVDPSGSRKEREIYTDIRYFDAKSNSWPATFVDPEHASMARFTGGAVGEDRIVLETDDLGGGKTRWSFEDIRNDTFVFRDVASSDGGNSWRLQSEYHMKRQAQAPGLL